MMEKGVIYGDMQATGTPSDGTVLPASIASSGNFSFPEVTVTGDVNIADSIIHSGDTDTKIRFPAANQISFETTGSEAVRIDESGRLGIGHDNPSQLLTVRGNAPIIRIEENQSGGSKRLDLGVTNSGAVGYIGANQSASSLAFQTTNNERMRITSAGLVGIGTTSPAALLNLDVDTEANLGSGSEGIRLTSGSSNAQLVRLGSSYSNNSVTGPGTLLYSSNKLSIRCDNSNPITFHTGSTVAERMRIDSSGKVGIGEDAPQQKLHLHEASSNGNFMVFTNSTTGATGNDGVLFGINSDEGGTIWNQENTYIRFGTNDTERIRIDSSGNVGIGTTSPDHVLDLGSSTAGRALTFSSYTNLFSEYSSGALWIASNFYGNTGASGYKTGVTGNFGAAAVEVNATGDSSNSGIIRFYTDSNSSKTAGNAFTPTERMRLNQGGNLLIGRTTVIDTSEVLGIKGRSSDHCTLGITTDGTSNMGVIAFNDNDGSFRGRLQYRHSTDAMELYTNGSERLRIDNVGKLLLGITASNDTSEVFLVAAAGTGDHCGMGIKTNNNVHDGYYAFHDSDASFRGSMRYDHSVDDMFFTTNGNNERMRIDSSGLISLATTTTANARLFVNPNVDGTTQRGITISGRKDVYDVIALNFVHATNNSSAGSVQFTSTAAVQYVTSSDYRLKQDVVTLTDSITKLKQLNPVHFKWKDMPSVETDGFLAHEVQTIVPSAIIGEKDAVDKDGNIEPQQIDTSKLVPLLVAALQEEISKREALEARVAALEAA
jgi:hypothetical protein